MAQVYYTLIKAKRRNITQVPDTGTLQTDVLALLEADGLDGYGNPLSTEPAA